jgi:hypothetical protein
VAQLEIDRQARNATRRLSTRPSHDLADYAGDYEHPGYGRIAIAYAQGQLNWAHRGMSEPLAHRHYDTFELPEAPVRQKGEGGWRRRSSFWPGLSSGEASGVPIVIHREAVPRRGQTHWGSVKKEGRL